LCPGNIFGGSSQNPKILKNIVVLLALQISIFIQPTASALYFAVQTPYQVCFTPGEDCTDIVVKTINDAKQSVYVQAYSFTSAPIAGALVSAKRRGLDVKVLLDKSQIKNNKYSSAKFLMNNGIETWIDYRPAIAHNKVILIDHKIVITGSFNFTQAAQKRNAENLIIIDDKNLSKTYLSNWLQRKNVSMTPESYLDFKNKKSSHAPRCAL